jgi:2-polyprenyl-6-methoxyphenol hydroxylase-like FAD-dependent oxidoreductase
MDTERARVTCCVVGGGPAGIMTGVLLARAGVDVLVLEKHEDFLRDFRGDTVHPSTLEVLGELGWLDAFLRRPHQELQRLRAHVHDADVTLADFRHCPTRCKFVAFMPQWDFLDFLVDRARSYPKFALRRTANVTDLLEENGRVAGVLAETPDGPLEVRADLVIGADGRHSTVRVRAGLRAKEVGAPMDVVWLRLPRRPSDPTQSLGWVERGHILALIDRGDAWQIGFVIPKGGFDALRARGIEAFRRELAKVAPFLADRARGIASFDELSLLVVQIDRLERWWRPGALCIGDSAHAMSPVGGVGINLAIQDAVATASLLARPLAGGKLSDRHLARVQRRRELPTRATQAVQIAVQKRVIGRVLEDVRPLRVGPLLRALDRSPFLQRIPARLVGMGIRPEHVIR